MAVTVPAIDDGAVSALKQVAELAKSLGIWPANCAFEMSLDTETQLPVMHVTWTGRNGCRFREQLSITADRVELDVLRAKMVMTV